MRSFSRIGFGGLLAAAVLACVFAAQPAQAQVICQNPSTVPILFLVSIEHRVSFTPSPGEALCDKIAATEVKGCYKLVQDAAKCTNALNSADAKAQDAVCQTLVDPTEGQQCLDDVKADLDSLNAIVKTQASSGQDSCLTQRASIRAFCLGVPP